MVFLLLLFQLLPATSDSVPLLAQFLLFIYVVNVASILLCVWIIGFSFRLPSTHVMSDFVRAFFLDWLPRRVLRNDSRPEVEPENDVHRPKFDLRESIEDAERKWRREKSRTGEPDARADADAVVKAGVDEGADAQASDAGVYRVAGATAADHFRSGLRRGKMRNDVSDDETLVKDGEKRGPLVTVKEMELFCRSGGGKENGGKGDCRGKDSDFKNLANQSLLNNNNINKFSRNYNPKRRTGNNDDTGPVR